MWNVIQRAQVVTALVLALALGTTATPARTPTRVDAETGVSGAYDLPVPPALPPSEEHQARKNRYVSVDPGTNGANPVALKVTLTSMMRCTTDDTRSCATDGPCLGVCSGDGERSCWTDSWCESVGAGFCVHDPCIEHGDVGLTWWVQQPEQNPNGCIPACTDEDWYARVDPDNMLFRVWTLETLHIGDCEIIPVATYEVRACLPPDGTVCSEPLTIGTILKPFGAHYGDVVGGAEDGVWTPPQRFVNHNDLRGYIAAKWNGPPTLAPPHLTWVDLEGPGSAPQYVLNVADFQQINLGAHLYDPYTNSPVNREPGECNGVCPNGRCDLGESPCNCEPDCGSPPTLESNCDDGVDEDCDGPIDCEEDDCAGDPACTNPRERVIEWVPVDPPAEVGNSVTVPAGSDVTLHLMVSGWDPNLDGDPELGAFQARLDSVGYSSGDGAPLNPSPVDQFHDALRGLYVCASDWGTPPETFDPLSECEGPYDPDCPQTLPWCVWRPDFIIPYYGIDGVVLSTATQDYTWEICASSNHYCAQDTGEPRYAWTLVLEVPLDAHGTYTIGFDPDPEETLMTDCEGARIPDLTLRPAEITVMPGIGACCDRFDGTCQDNIVGLQCLGASQELIYDTVCNPDPFDPPCAPLDCNGDGTPDIDETNPAGQDCDFDGLCNGEEIGSATQQDCQPNGIPDDCEIRDCTGSARCSDCNENGIPDECDITGESSDDCDIDGIPDECESDEDCNTNGIRDFCELATADCNRNGVPDDCDLDAGVDSDCNTNDVPDGCDVDTGSSGDCNDNAIPDECDINDCPAEESSCKDSNADGIPDGCTSPSMPCEPQNHRKNRYLSIDTAMDTAFARAIEVTLSSMKRCDGDRRRACVTDGDCPGVCDNDHDLQCSEDAICAGGSCMPTSPCIEHPDVGQVVRWVDQPYVSECVPLNDCTDQWFANLVDTAVYRVWTEDVVHITDCEIVPVATYTIRATPDGVGFSDLVTVGTIAKPQVHYGDCVGPVVGWAFTPADGFTNVTDVQGYLIAIQRGATAPHTTWVDVHGTAIGTACTGSDCVIPQQILNVADLQTIKFGFIGKTYVDTPGQVNPSNCP